MKTGKPLRMERDGQGIQRMSDSTLKDSVAAHQAECSCHVVGHGCCSRWASVHTELHDGPAHIPTTTGVRDLSGTPWHLDPLCKVRPEARA